MKHLDLLNSLLAIRFRQPGWPTLLPDHEYHVYSIGVGFSLADSTLVAPDLLAASASRRVALLIEIKGGVHPDLGQVDRMLRVNSQDLRDFAHLPGIDPANHRVGVVEMCNQQDFDHFVTELTGKLVTVLGFDGKRFRLGGAQLPDPALATAIEGAQITQWPPLAAVPFDRDSSLGDIARVILPEVVAQLVHGGGTIGSDGIIRKTHTLIYDVMASTGARSERADILRKVAEVLREAGTNELSDWVEKIQSQPLWRFRKTLSVDQAQKTRELKALEKASNDLCVRLGATPGVQLQLFDEPMI